MFSDPLAKRDPRPEMNVLLPEVQQRLLELARSRKIDRPTHWGIEFPCSSFCDWMLRNGGTRTRACPQGSPDGPRWEQEGTELARFAAALFGAVADNGAVAWAENPAPSGRYPSAWDLAEWQAVLQRTDVAIIPIDLCEYGCGPPDAPALRHRKRTWVVTNDPAMGTVARRCSGQHDHLALTGRRPGARFSYVGVCRAAC